jgi:hypothetical protein
MRKRSAGTTQTQVGIRTSKIIDIVSRYALLHAYGIGLDQFRELPEQSRMRSIDYAKWLLAFALDDEIDSGYLFFRAMKCHEFKSKACNYVHSSYLQYIYSFWRKLSGSCEADVPLGCFAVAALILDQKVMFTHASKPCFYTTVPSKRLAFMEEFLEKSSSFKPWRKEQYRFVKQYSREDEMGNEPQCVDATEEEG